MKRRTAIFCAATLLALVPAPAGASPANFPDNPQVGERHCIPVGEECIPFDEIDENTELYATQLSDGSFRGFTDFTEFADWIQVTYGVVVRMVGGNVEFDFTRGREDSSKDTRADALWATFYNRGDFTGPAFVLNPPNAISDLNTLPYPNGGSWNNRISSVVTTGGTTGLPGAALCARAACATPGWVLVIPNNAQIQLAAGFNNRASYVGVFS